MILESAYTYCSVLFFFVLHCSCALWCFILYSILRFCSPVLLSGLYSPGSILQTLFSRLDFPNSTIRTLFSELYSPKSILRALFFELSSPSSPLKPLLADILRALFSGKPIVHFDCHDNPTNLMSYSPITSLDNVSCNRRLARKIISSLLLRNKSVRSTSSLPHLPSTGRPFSCPSSCT